MSFAWLDDDDEDDGVPQSQTTNGIYEAATVFHCNNCGSSETYIDSASELRVCSDCFTTHLQSQQETIEFEEIAVLATKTPGGAFRKSAGRRGPRGIRKPLEDFDTSQPLPELELCLQAMKLILVASTEILCNEILPNLTHQQPSIYRLTEEDPKRLKHQVRDLWMAYLRSWADGAQYYGKLYPHARFCMRDSFLALIHRTLLGRFLENKHLSEKNSTNNDAEGSTPLEKDKASNKTKGRKKTVTFDTKDEKGYSDDEDDGAIEDDSDDEKDSEDDENGQDEEKLVTDQGDKAEFSATAATERRNFKATRLTQFGVLRDLLHSHCAEHDQSFDYKTAALLIKPSMHLVAAILWLALLANNVVIPTFQFLRWIETGQIPLKTAFDDLIPSDELKKRLKLVSCFFRSYRQPIPAKFDRLVTAFAVACRIRSNAYEFCYRKQGCFSFFTHQFIWNGPHTLALRMAQFSAAAGLPRSVLDRALMLAGLPPTADSSASDTDRDSSGSDDSSMNSSFSNSSGPTNSNISSNRWKEYRSPTKPTKRDKTFDVTGPNTIKGIPQVTNPQDVATPEDVLALLAIACQFDPDWREWKYFRTSEQQFVMPHNETELLNMANPSRYLKHCYEKVFVEMQDPDSKPEKTLPLPKTIFSEHELKAGDDVNALNDKSSATSEGSIDESRDSSSPSIHESTNGLIDTPKHTSVYDDGFESDDLFVRSPRKSTFEETELNSNGFESDDVFGGPASSSPMKQSKDGKSSGFDSDDDIFAGPGQKHTRKESKNSESSGIGSDDDIFGGPTNEPTISIGNESGNARSMKKTRQGYDSDDSSAQELTKELLSGSKSKTVDDGATTAERSVASRNRSAPASKTSKQKRSRGKRAEIEELSDGDDLSDRSIEKSGIDASSQDEEAWGLHPLKPATLLKPNDVICGMPYSPKPRRGTKRLRDNNATVSKQQDHQGQRRPCDFSSCNLADQWMDASMPRLDPKVLQLLQHLAYSADLTTIDHVEDLMVYYVQGYGIARNTDRQLGREMTIRSRTKVATTVKRPYRPNLPGHLYSRFSWAGRPESK